MVASSGKMTWPDCSPPRDQPPRSSASSTYRSPTAVSSTWMPSACHGQAEAQVGHHRHDDGVVDQLAPVGAGRRRQMAMRWSPSTSRAGGVHGQDPIGVAVEGETGVGPAATTRGLQVLGVGRAATGVDVGAVGLGVDDLDVGAEALSAPGAERDAEPLAQSTTRWRPSSARRGTEATDRVDPRGADRIVLGRGERRRGRGRVGRRRSSSASRRSSTRRSACARPERRT